MKRLLTPVCACLAVTEIASGTNSQIRDDAKTELPMLKTHLRLSRAALAASGK